MIFNVLWNIVLGIIGGIISSVIVSRVFLLQSEIQKVMESLESGLYKLNYLHGMVYTLRIVLQHKYDEREKKHAEMERRGYKTEEEYYVAHRDIDWIDANDLQKEIIKKANNEAERAFDELRNINTNDHEANEIIDTYINYVNKIQFMKEVSFSFVDEVGHLHDEAIKQFEKYKKNNGRRIFKRILTDRVMICLYILIFLIIAATITTKILGI